MSAFSIDTIKNSFWKTAALLTIFGVIFMGWAYGATEHAPIINWSHLVMVLCGGLALFLFGMDMMSDALKSALGNQMEWF